MACEHVADVSSGLGVVLFQQVMNMQLHGMTITLESECSEHLRAEELMESLLNFQTIADSDPRNKKHHTRRLDSKHLFTDKKRRRIRKGKQNNHNLLLGSGSTGWKVSKYLRLSINVLPSHSAGLAGRYHRFDFRNRSLTNKNAG